MEKCVPFNKNQQHALFTYGSSSLLCLYKLDWNVMSNKTIWWNRYVLFITQKSTTCFGTIHGHLQVDNEKRNKLIKFLIINLKMAMNSAEKCS